MKKQFVVLMVLTVLVSSSFAVEFKKTLGDIELKDGDTFVFIGDSITHQCLYTQYVEDYFYTRYPDKKIHIRNAGISGDKAKDVLDRFDEDIAKFEPDYATILIGMNDGEYTNFTDEIFNTYRNDMTKVLDRLAEIGTIAIPMTPTMFDLQAAMKNEMEMSAERANRMNYNAVLSFFGMWGMKMANERGLGFVNMYEPLNRYTREQRKENPDFTLIRDSVHPEEDGQLVMALALLEGIGADPLVSCIDIDRRDGKWIVEAQNGKLSKVKKDKLSFTFKAKSLPWVVPEDAQFGFKMTDAAHKMSQEIIRITGLEYCDYDLKIDGKTVGTYTHREFAAGVELQSNEKTPQYQQAMKVALLNKKRNEEVIAPMRDYWLMRKSYFDDGGEEWKKEVFGTENPTEEMLDEYTKKAEKYTKPDKDLVKKIYKINKPVAHKYEIVASD